MKHGTMRLVVVLGAMIGGGCTFTTYSTPGSAPASDLYGYQSDRPDRSDGKPVKKAVPTADDVPSRWRMAPPRSMRNSAVC